MYDNINELIGSVMVRVEAQDREELVFETEAGDVYKFYHEQDCCEHVRIEDICGDLEDLVGMPILMAEEVSHEGTSAPNTYCDSYTWTFYKFATNKGSVTVRWLGLSNGYYSERVHFAKIK